MRFKHNNTGGVYMAFSLFILFANLAIIIAIPIICYNEKIKEEEKKKQQAEYRKKIDEENREREKKYAVERGQRVRQREIEEREKRNNPTLQSYTPSYYFANDNSCSSISSGFNYSSVRPNDDFLNKMGNPYISNLERQIIAEAEIQRMVDSHLPMNSIYRNSDGSVKQHDYSAFGIMSNTPGIDLAEAQMFEGLN